MAFVGSFMSARMARAEGKMLDAQGEAQQAIANYNAKLQEREAKARMQAARLQERRVSKKGKAVQGAQRARFAKSGIALTSPSAIDVLADTAFEVFMDRNLTLRGGLLESQALKNQAKMTRAQGDWAAKVGEFQMGMKRLESAGYTWTGIGQAASAVGSMGLIQQGSPKGTTITQQPTQSQPSFFNNNSTPLYRRIWS